ncbi:LPS biosynthesis protein [uncultured Clostridium sp.]|nr:LPS biosynthesis protein [uncultured Clostridium sp.]
MLKNMRPGLDDKYGILELQDKILEIMIYIDEICKKEEIDYCLMAGSALGAKRHKGFIPWDDDIDIYMTEEEYSRFRDVFNQKGDKERFYLQEWGKTDYKGQHMITMAKVRMNKTEIKEKAYLNWKIHQGIFVDIFVMHNCPNEIKKQVKQYLWAELVVLKGLQIRGYKRKNLKDAIVLKISEAFSRQWVLKHGLRNVYKYQNTKAKYVSGFIDTRDFKRAVFPKEIMFPTKYVDFENVKLRVPANNDEYLRIQFGEDYMSLPPIEKREVSKHAMSWNCVIDIKYDFEDENKLI